MKQSSQEILTAVAAAVVFIAAGMVMIYWGLYFYGKIHSLRKNGVKTEGTILRYRRVQGHKTNDMMLVPVVEFQTNSGKTIIVEGTVDNISLTKNICSSGERVEIIYDPEDPKNAVINTFAELWFAPLLLWFIGSGFIIVPPFTIWKYYHEKQGHYKTF